MQVYSYSYTFDGGIYPGSVIDLICERLGENGFIFLHIEHTYFSTVSACVQTRYVNTFSSMQLQSVHILLLLLLLLLLLHLPLVLGC